MPSTSTITSFYEFAPSTVIKSSYVNANFQNFRGHYLPIKTDTATASDLTHNLGAIDHYWKSSYIQEHYQKEIATGSTPPANSFNSYFKSDGKKYKKNSADVERTFLDTDLVLAKGDLLVGLGANTLTALTIGSNSYVLTADSATTTGMAWKANASNPLTTKGDLFCYDTTAARLPVGTNGQVLLADSTTITGLKWSTSIPLLTSWASFTVTGSWTSNTTYTGLWRRVGDTMEVQTKILLSGAPNSATLYVNIPSSYTIDTAKLTFPLVNRALPASSSTIHDTGIESYLGIAAFATTTAVAVQYIVTGNKGILSPVDQANPFTFGNTDTIQINYQVPITGWTITS
jgi:hypothetical protein